MGEIENIRIRERKKIEDARIAIITLGDSSTLPDAKRNKLEQTIRAALTARQEPINQELLDALKAENEALKAELEKRQWLPIESAPIDGCMWIILGRKNYAVPEIGYFNKRHNIWCDGTDRTLFMPHGPTHWMPLPDAPEVK